MLWVIIVVKSIFVIHNLLCRSSMIYPCQRLSMRPRSGFACQKADSCGKTMTLSVHMPIPPTAQNSLQRRKRPLGKGYSLTCQGCSEYTYEGKRKPYKRITQQLEGRPGQCELYPSIADGRSIGTASLIKLAKQIQRCSWATIQDPGHPHDLEYFNGLLCCRWRFSGLQCLSGIRGRLWIMTQWLESIESALGMASRISISFSKKPSCGLTYLSSTQTLLWKGWDLKRETQ